MDFSQDNFQVYGLILQSCQKKFDKNIFNTKICKLSLVFNIFPIGISFRKNRGNNQKNVVNQPKKQHRLNHEIRAMEIRLIDENDESLGTCSLQRGLDLAKEKGIDLVEISAKAVPPVCKLIDYGKMLYSMKKKEQKKKISNKPLEIKGIRHTFGMGEGDAVRQLEKSKEFLQEGHSIKFQLLMKGREKAHRDLALEKMKKFVQQLSEHGQVDNELKGAGHQILVIIKPIKSNH